MRVLIVNDDAEAVRKLVARSLKKDDKYEVVPASGRYGPSGPTPEQMLSEAMEIVDRSVRGFDAAIVDLSWKKGNYSRDYGFDLIYYLRGKGEFLPIFIVSLYSDEYIRDRLPQGDPRCRTHGTYPDFDQIARDLHRASELEMPSETERDRLISDYRRMLDEKKEQHEVEHEVARISDLKHHIAHCFLSIDIDLQGVAEVEENGRLGYLLDMFLGDDEVGHNWRPSGYYKGKLWDARRFILSSYSRPPNSNDARCLEMICAGILDRARAGQDPTTNDGILSRWNEVKHRAADPDVERMLGQLDDALEEVRTIPIAVGSDRERVVAEAEDWVQRQEGCFKLLNEVRTSVGDGGFCRFNCWFRELDVAINDLREAIGG